MGEERGSSRGKLGFACWVALIAATTGVVHAEIDTAVGDSARKLRLPDARIAKSASLGFHPLLADWVWVQALQLVGGDNGEIQQNASEIADAIEFVAALDPWVDHPYRFAALWLTNSADEVRRANKLLAKAIAYHPGDWRNRFYLGYNEFFFLQDAERAARALKPAIGMPGAPNYLGALVTRLEAESGDLDTAAVFLEQLIRSAPDEFARAEYLKAHDEIETERRARFLDQMRARFVKRNGRDLRSPAELWSGPARVMQKMPPPHPHFPGFEWVIDAETGRITSSFYGSRYTLHFHPLDLAQRDSWRKQGTVAAPARAGGEGEKL
jgi:tetratricopeptide (TPR) repeat protein